MLTLVLSALATAPAPQESASDDPSAVGIQLVGETTSGEVRPVPLASLPIDGLGELDLVVLDVLGTPEVAAVPARDLARLELVGGDRLQGRVVGGEGEQISLRLVGDVILPVDIAAFRSVVFPGRIPEDLTAPVEAPPELDRLYHRVGGALDPIDGTVEGFTPEGVRFESRRVGSRLVPWGEVAALFVEVLEDEPEAGSGGGRPVAVDLVDGSRLRGRMEQLSARGLSLTVGRDTQVSLPLTALAEIARNDGTIAFLSDLQAASEVGRGNPFESEAAGDELFGMVWPYRPDRAVTGGPLRAGGRTWWRGIGCHAPTRLTWELDGSWRQLRGAVAVDDSVKLEPAEGSVVFSILLDGEAVWTSQRLSSGQAPLPFPPLDLTGKRELVLVADMSDQLNQGDRADWLRMMLVR